MGALAVSKNLRMCEQWQHEAQVVAEEAGPEEPEEASCTVCKEGYASSPGRLLCAYVYSRLEPAGSFPAAAPPGHGATKQARASDIAEGPGDLVWFWRSGRLVWEAGGLPA